MQQWLYRASRRAPRLLARFLQGKVRREIGGVVDVERDFAPRYDPWDERLCLLPDGDLFDALRSARASIVTAQIAELTADGIRLTSGEVLPADAIISATGLQLNLMGDVSFSVDGEPVDFADTWTYKGMMFSGVPNLVSVFGYVNASWTLRADLIARWTTRLLRFMRERSLITATPVVPDDLARRMPARPWIDDFSPGYMRRVMHRFPRQGDRAPWINPQDYRADRRLFLKQPIDDGSLHFTGARCRALLGLGQFGQQCSDLFLLHLCIALVRSEAGLLQRLGHLLGRQALQLRGLMAAQALVGPGECARRQRHHRQQCGDRGQPFRRTQHVGHLDTPHRTRRSCSVFHRPGFYRDRRVRGSTSREVRAGVTILYRLSRQRWR
jgi:hypothetical protein